MQSPSHSQSVGVLCSHWVIQHSISSLGDRCGVSGPGDSGSRSTSGDAGQGEVWTGPIEVRVHCQHYLPRYFYISCKILSMNSV